MVLLMEVSKYHQKLLMVVCQFVKCQRLNLLMEMHLKRQMLREVLLKVSLKNDHCIIN